MAEGGGMEVGEKEVDQVTCSLDLSHHLIVYIGHRIEIRLNTKPRTNRI